SPKNANATHWRVANAPSSRRTKERRMARASRPTASRPRANERNVTTSAARYHREAQDRLRRSEMDRERARHESDELAQRIEQLGNERAQLADALTAIDRELETAAIAVAEARARVENTATRLEEIRAADRDTRDR